MRIGAGFAFIIHNLFKIQLYTVYQRGDKMRFIERIIMGLGYHKRVHLLTLLSAMLFTAAGLFFQTNLRVENLSANNFTKHLHQFSPVAVRAVNRAGKAVTNAHQLQQQKYLLGFWIALAVFAVVTLVIALFMAKKRRGEVKAYLLADKSKTDIALQVSLESIVAYGVGFTATALISMIHTGFFTSMLTRFNRQAFTRTFVALDGLKLQTASKQLAKLFSGKITDFNLHGLLYGRGQADHLLDGLAGYSVSLAFGCSVVLLIHFFVAFVHTYRIQKTI